ncbi:MAG TPA: hypothetical protein VGC87_11685 [Pyrinomonadaceae bacterium]|jgi:hypothetical protein
MERVWIIASVVGVAAAAVLLLAGYDNAAFVAGALGAVAWFLNFRSRLRSTIPRDEEMETGAQDEEDVEDENEVDASRDEDEK